MRGHQVDSAPASKQNELTNNNYLPTACQVSAESRDDDLGSLARLVTERRIIVWRCQWIKSRTLTLHHSTFVRYVRSSASLKRALTAEPVYLVSLLGR